MNTADNNGAAGICGRRCLIVGGGDLTPAFLKERLEAYPDAFVVAADRGLEALKAAGRLPDHLLGDFDSASPETFEAFLSEKAAQDGDAARPADAAQDVIDRYPSEKDFTDTEAAVRYAISHKASEVILLGMTGGRLDHFLAAVQNMLQLLEAGIPAVMEDPLNRLFLIRGKLRLVLRKEETFGSYLSLIPVTEDLRGLTLKGMKYPLDRAQVKKGVSLCVSNEITEDEAVIDLEEGTAVVILSRDSGR